MASAFRLEMRSKQKRSFAVKRVPNTDHPKLTARQIDIWCAQGEGHTVEYKSDDSLTPEDLVGFANANGGIVLLGVEELSEKNGIRKGKVVGLTKKVTDVRQRINHYGSSCQPPVVPRFQRVNHPRGTVLVVFIEKAASVTCTGGGTYKRRIEASLIPIPPEMLKLIFLEQESTTFLSRFREASADVLDTLRQLGTDLKDDLASLSSTTEKIEELTESVVSQAEDLHGVAAEISDKVDDVGSIVENSASDVSSVNEQFTRLAYIIQNGPEEICRFDPRGFDFSNEFSEISERQQALSDEVQQNLGQHIEESKEQFEISLGNTAEGLKEELNSSLSAEIDEGVRKELREVSETVARIERRIDRTDVPLGSSTRGLPLPKRRTQKKEDQSPFKKPPE